jgi:hypothetical protein
MSKDWVAWPRASVPLGFSSNWRECNRRFESTNFKGPKSSYNNDFAVMGWTQTGNMASAVDDYEASWPPLGVPLVHCVCTARQAAERATLAMDALRAKGTQSLPELSGYITQGAEAVLQAAHRAPHPPLCSHGGRL